MKQTNGAFWQYSNGDHVVKQGIELNLQIFKEVLKDEHKKYVRKIHSQKKSSFSIVSESIASTLEEIDPVDNESLPKTSTSITNLDSCLTSSVQVIKNHSNRFLFLLRL